jgi:hypothetical protein
MSQSQTSSVIQSLETVRDKVKQRLMKVPEYRAFLAIEKPIAEVADISDLVAYLQTAKQKIVERLTATREYRALLTIEKAIKDVSEIIEVVGPDLSSDTAPVAAEKVVGKKESPFIKAVPAVETQQPAAATAVAAPVGNAPPTVTVTEMPETYARVASELAAAIETAGDPPPEKPASHSPERLSTLGLVEEWRLTALVGDSSAADAGNEDARPAGEGQADAETAKVA